MIRAFLAIDLPESYRTGLAAVQDYLRKSGADVRWTSVAGIHLTLKFFGDIEENQVDALAAAATGAAGPAPGFTLDVEGVGTFPGPKNPRVIWLGLSGQTDVLARLVRNLEQCLGAVGFSAGKAQFYAPFNLGPGPFQPGAGSPEPFSGDGSIAGFFGILSQGTGSLSQHAAPPGSIVYPTAPDRSGYCLSDLKSRAALGFFDSFTTS